MKNNQHPIEKYMVENNLNKKQLAEKCSVSVYTINNIISGKNIKSAINVLKRICSATKLRADDICNFKK